MIDLEYWATHVLHQVTPCRALEICRKKTYPNIWTSPKLVQSASDR